MNLYNLIDILTEEQIFILDNDGLGYILPVKEVKYRYNNDKILNISIEQSEWKESDSILFVKINGICKNED